MGKWWNDETPIVAVSKKNVLRLYVKAKKLMVSRPDWEDDNGEMKPGKSTVLDLAALNGNDDAREILASAVDMMDA